MSKELEFSYALSRHVPDMMVRGFVIHTSYGDLEIAVEEASPFVLAVTKLMQKKLKQAKRDKKHGH